MPSLEYLSHTAGFSIGAEDEMSEHVRIVALAANADPDYYDLGLCGPLRTDLKDQAHYCGMLITPTLRNAATCRAFLVTFASMSALGASHKINIRGHFAAAAPGFNLSA